MRKTQAKTKIANLKGRFALRSSPPRECRRSRAERGEGGFNRTPTGPGGSLVLRPPRTASGAQNAIISRNGQVVNKKMKVE